MNKKGYGAIGFIFLFIFLLIMWPFVFAPLFNYASQNAIVNGVTGLEAFFWSNLNLWFFLALFLVVLIYLRFGGTA